MAINVLQAAKYLAKESGWKLTRLELQKIIYLAHMVYLGKNKKPLVEGNFEAWQYGPVHRVLYEVVKESNSLIVDKSILDFVPNLDEKHEEEMFVLKKILDIFPPGSAAKLIAVSHWKSGAWIKHYDENKYNIIIPQKDILKEYAARFD